MFHLHIIFTISAKNYNEELINNLAYQGLSIAYKNKMIEKQFFFLIFRVPIKFPDFSSYKRKKYLFLYFSQKPLSLFHH